MGKSKTDWEEAILWAYIAHKMAPKYSPMRWFFQASMWYARHMRKRAQTEEERNND